MCSTTYSNVASVSYARLENGSCKYETRGTIDHYSYRRVTLLVPKGEVDISVEDGKQFLNIVRMKYLEAGCRINASSTNLGLMSCKSPPPTSNPQHRIFIDSSTFDECGSFKPLVTSYGMNPDPASLLQTELFLLYTNYTKSYEFWLNDESRVKMQLIVQWEIYDLRSTQFSQQKQPRSWVIERTITRRVARKLEQSTGNSTARYKGVRWRPERKHPWVAEMKLPKRKKMWIGNFDTPEEAAQAYIEAAKCYQRQKTLSKSQGASREHVCVESKLQPPVASLEHRALNTSINNSSSPFHLQDDSFGGPNLCVESKLQPPVAYPEHRALDTSINNSSSPFHLQDDSFGGPNLCVESKLQPPVASPEHRALDASINNSASLFHLQEDSFGGPNLCVESKLQPPVASLEHRALDTSTNNFSSPFHLQDDSFGGPNFPTLGAMSANHLTSNDHDDRGIEKLLDSNSNSEASVSDESCKLFEPHDLSLAGPKDLLSAYICNTSSSINAEIEPPYMFAKDLPVMVDRSFMVEDLSTSNQNIVDCPDPFELVS